MHDLIGGFKPIPIDARDAYGSSARIDDLIAAGAPISGPRAKAAPDRLRNRMEMETEAETEEEKQTDSKLATPSQRWPERDKTHIGILLIFLFSFSGD
jgi:hypothetical protein